MSQTSQLYAVLHARVSTQKQRDGHSLSTQLAAERELATQLGAVVVEEIAVDISGAEQRDYRADLDRVRNLIQSHKANCVIFFEIDRTTRGGLVDYLLLIEELKAAGASIYFAQRKTKAGETPDEKLLDNIMAVFAERERQVIRERTMRGRRGKAESGQYVGGGTPPYGYVTEGNLRTVSLVINPDTSPIVVEIFQRFTGTNGYEQQGTRAICRELTARGVLTPADVLGRAKRVRKVGEWDVTSLYKILHNPVYKGQATTFRYQRNGRHDAPKRSERRVERPEGDWQYARVPALLSEGLWDTAQARIASGQMTSLRNTKYAYLFAKRLHCQCGFLVRGKPVVRANGKLWRYYCCNSRQGIHKNMCDTGTMPVAPIDDNLWQWVQERLLQPTHMDATESSDDADQQSSLLVSQRTSLTQQLLDVDTERQRLIRFLRKDMITEDDFTKQKYELDEQETHLRATLARIEHQYTNHQQRIGQQVELDLSLDFYRERAVNADFATRQALLDALNVHVFVRRTNHATWLLHVTSVFRFDTKQDERIVSVNRRKPRKPRKPRTE